MTDRFDSDLNKGLSSTLDRVGLRGAPTWKPHFFGEGHFFFFLVLCVCVCVCLFLLLYLFLLLCFLFLLPTDGFGSLDVSMNRGRRQAMGALRPGPAPATAGGERGSDEVPGFGKGLNMCLLPGKIGFNWVDFLFELAFG